jgi:hypothetical protein
LAPGTRLASRIRRARVSDTLPAANSNSKITHTHISSVSSASLLFSNRVSPKVIAVAKNSKIGKKKQMSMGNQDDFVKIGAVVGMANGQRRALSKNDHNPNATGAFHSFNNQ